MSNGLRVFVNEFMDYVLCCLPFDCLNFGNMDYDYSLECGVSGDYILSIYDVALDHYGMPYRNMLCCEIVDVSDLLK